MTDNEIIKALGQCETQSTCSYCPYFEKIGCKKHLYQDAYRLIIRQKAEIERLTAEVEEKSNKLGKILPIVSDLKAEAIKEFAEKLKDVYANDKRYDRPNAHTLIVKLFDNIDTLVEELTVNYESNKNDKQRKEDEGK